MLTAIYAVLVFSLIISIHEFGHFIMAKINKVTVREFSVGMGPKLFSHKGQETEYSLRLFPIGGYVKLEGEDGDSNDINAFCNKKPVRRLSVLFAGAFMNFVLGFLIFVMLFSFSDGIETNTIGEVLPYSAFEQAGIQKGDKIIYAEGENYSSRIRDYNDINFFLSKNGVYDTTFTFKRGSITFKKEISPKYMDDYKREMMGFSPLLEKPRLLNVLKASYRQSIFVIKLVFNSFLGLITGDFSLSQMSGPVGIVNEIGNAAQEGMAHGFLQSLFNVLSLAALISINLGVVNLLPLPALDGGRILFVFVELIRRKPISAEHESAFHFLGFILLIILMIVVTFSDIGRLIN